MGKQASAEPQSRTSIVLSDEMWLEIEALRKAAPGKVPTKMAVLRALLREALDARAGRETRP